VGISFNYASVFSFVTLPGVSSAFALQQANHNLLIFDGLKSEQKLVAMLLFCT
jgi:hypothetical protein